MAHRPRTYLLLSILAIAALAPLTAATTGGYVHHGVLAPHTTPFFVPLVFVGSQIYIFTATAGDVFHATVTPDSSSVSLTLQALPSSKWSCGTVDCPQFILNAEQCMTAHSTLAPAGEPSALTYTALTTETHYFAVESGTASGATGYTFTLTREDGTSPANIRPDAFGTREGAPFAPQCWFI